MDTFEIPICKKAYELYRTFHNYRKIIPKHERFTIFERCEKNILDIIENILLAAQSSRNEKGPMLKKASLKLNVVRMFIRLLRENKALDNRRYLTLERIINEIGKMLGGWIKSL